MKFFGFLLLCLFFLKSFSQPFNAKVDVQNTNCQPNGGAASVSASGGTLPYTFLWSNGSTTANVSGLSAGIYEVTVYNFGKTDSVVRSFTVKDSATINFLITPNDTVCIGTKVEITALATPAGGSFVWSGGDLQIPRNGDSIHVKPQSDQSYFVNYSHPTCSGSGIVRIEAGLVQASLGGIQQPTCGLPNGSIIGAGSGYNAVFTWLKNGQPLNTNASILSGLSSGTYTFILRDDIAGCSDTVKNIVLEDVTSFASISSINISADNCLSASGSATIAVVGGSGNYTFKWSHANSVTTATAANLAKGTYRVTINDGVCTPFDTLITIPGPADSLMVIATGTDDNCSSNTGTATAVASGATPPYTYVWSNGATGQQALGLAGNSTYTVTATDALGCTSDAAVSIGDIPAPNLSFLSFDSLCPSSSNGMLQLSASGGLPPYSYSWSHNNGLNASVATGLVAGAYTATVSDAGGCTAVAQVVIAEFDNPQIDLGSNISIFKGEVATLSVQTSLPVNAVEWTPFIQSSENSLVAYPKPDDTSTFFVRVRYGKGCELTDSITVYVLPNEPEVIIPNIFTPNNDNVNDFFYITHKAIERFDVRIFDRWGNKVFESTNPDFKWDGNNLFTGAEAPNGVYTYSIEYTGFSSAKKLFAKGSITLVR